jgi:hypothetical protein
MPNVLLIGGHFQKVRDQSPYWSLAQKAKDAGHKVRTRECIQNIGREMEVCLDDVLWADIVVSGSHGTASKKKLIKDAEDAKKWPADKRHSLWVILVGVPEPLYQQFPIDLWHAPDFVDRAVAYHVDDWPCDEVLKNKGAVWTSVLNPLPANRYINVNCNHLFPPIMLLSQKHSGMFAHPEVLDSIASLFSIPCTGSVAPLVAAHGGGATGLGDNL